ncbi:hypothetical protein P3T76_015644 [Phytophthora citrophthora]|uniref:Uncharacterized protein n=1 Tax=Phytophthora citrophthora TaxID=4793 RepID=A0AAD9FZB6_9STRA|nr:hypothetical protein P3T76_015644 [Phytophthora citrophthora]
MSEVSLPLSVDQEMFCQSLAVQGLEVGSTLAEAVLGFCSWAHCKWRPEEAQAAEELLVPLPQPIAFALRTESFITESLDEMKTQLQLIHAVVDDLQSKAEQIDSKLDGLQEQLRRVPVCRCRRQDTHRRVVAPSTNQFSSPSNVQHVRAPPMFESKRLEIPM